MRKLPVILWICQILLAALFLFAGIMKFIMPMQQMTKGSSLPGWFFYFIGAMEILGAIGLIAPALLRIRPTLTPLAAVCLVIIMIGATAITIPMSIPGALFPLTIGALTLFVAYGRYRLHPIPARR